MFNYKNNFLKYLYLPCSTEALKGACIKQDILRFRST